MNGENEKYSSYEQGRVIEALGMGLSKSNAAAIAGVDVRTVERWLTDPGFVKEVEYQKKKLANLLRSAKHDLKMGYSYKITHIIKKLWRGLKSGFSR